MRRKTNKEEFVLIEGKTDGPVRFCFHLEDLPKDNPVELSVSRPFRIVCNLCRHHVNEDMATKELIFELSKMSDYAVKYAILAKGLKKVCDMMAETKIERVLDVDLFAKFMKIFETKRASDNELYSDLIFAVKHFQFDEELYKFTMYSPEYETVFHPKRNINHIDVRFILERMGPLFLIYHKMIQPEFKLQDPSRPPVGMIEIVTWGDTEEEFDEAVKAKSKITVEEEPVVEEKKYLDIPSKRKDRLVIEYHAPHSVLRRVDELELADKDITESEFEMEYDALKIIYIDTIFFDKELTHQVCENNMEDVGKRIKVQSVMIKKFGDNGPLPTDFQKKMYFNFEIGKSSLFFVIYPDKDKKLKEWNIHSLQLFTSGLNLNDKPLINKTAALKEKFLKGMNRILRDFIPTQVVLTAGQSIFPLKPSNQREHFVSLERGIDPDKFPRRICLRLIKRSLENWQTFDLIRNFTLSQEEVLKKDIIDPEKSKKSIKLNDSNSSRLNSSQEQTSKRSGRRDYFNSNITGSQLS